MENELIKKAIEVLEKQKRPEQIIHTVYGEYSPFNKTFLYDDAEKSYRTYNEKLSDREVRSVNAFIDVIKEELRRRENADGDRATVRLNLSGGRFCADDNTQSGITIYNRLNSQQWNLFKNGINKRMNHTDFLLFLQALKPSFMNFDKIFREFVQLRLVGRSTITSNPIITEEGQQSGYMCTYKLENGADGEATFPTGFEINLQFAKAGAMMYELQVDLLFYRNDNDELMIQVLCPMFEHIEEQAIIDEATYVKEHTENYPKLLILSDF